MRPLALIFLLASATFAQGLNGIVTSVSRTVSIAPDEGDFTVVVSTTLDTTQQQIVETFQNTGIQNVDVLSVVAGPNTVTYPPPAESQLYYAVRFSVNPPALKDYAKKLDAMRASLPAGLTSLQYSASLNASSAAVDAVRRSLLPQLVSDARKKAVLTADAGGLKLGPIQGIAESFYGVMGASASWFNVPSYVYSPVSGSNGTQYSFSLTVTFATVP